MSKIRLKLILECENKSSVPNGIKEIICKRKSEAKIVRDSGTDFFVRIPATQNGKTYKREFCENLKNNTIFIVAFSVDLKCPSKIYFNTFDSDISGLLQLMYVLEWFIRATF